jgi:hypothetical protein
MLASIHLADVHLRTAVKVLRSSPEPISTPGLRYASVVGTASLGARLPVPQPRRVGLIALWDDEAALDGFLAAHPLAADLDGGWHVRLETVQAHEYHQARGSDMPGSWPGVSADITGPSLPDGPVVVLTLARTRPSQFLRFGRASLQAARPLGSSPGLIWASALARPPIVATCSLWSSPAALSAYAYGSANSGHGRAMAADRRQPFHQSGVFFRFHPTRSTGQLDGRNPLPADWMTNKTSGSPKPITH